ncbi:tyrosine decarboxylase MfnA [Thiospirochaeta perfilievii]|uniref:Tyrosine decarboxylase MfnA n=1 Tax=Thiospirochaeta perfilievii TaxID=252967 RepID=A0A5C1QD71_9SPIO|nr:tyrosine decarboxylase MfnA [Thiospirochaeta perfilievii]QEN04664.1 tyrosine decarboxylase MfnA [Thiospirochaeta perfilievii]
MNISRLKKRLSGDHDFKGHTILGSMCTEPHKMAVKTYKRFLSTNVGDPGLFPKLIQLETEYIASLGRLLSNDSAVGSVVSGGSEANILALWSARNRSEKGKREVIISETCHFSFDKAADLLGLQLIKIPVGNDYKIRVDLVEKAITDKSLAIVGIAGTTGLGVCDPIEELSKIAVKNNLYLHVDAAFGGFVFPFIDNSPKFDFSLDGVMSITVDPHKMGRAVIQSGCIIYRNREIAESINIDVTYLSGGRAKNRSVLGTRSGASIAASWMVYNYLGYKGYKKNIDRSMKLTYWFIDEIKKIDGLGVKVQPESNIVGLCASKGLDIKEILFKIRERGWAVSEWPDYIRITFMPHVTKRSLKKFLVDLRSIVQSLHGNS